MRKETLFTFVTTFSLLMAAQEHPQSTVRQVAFYAETLGETFAYTVYLPAGYEGSQTRYPTLYLLHGRGDTMSAWLEVRDALDTMIADGEAPPLVAIMPDAPWSERASYYVDSHYTGFPPGMRVESAFFDDLIPHVDSTYQTLAGRDSQAISGYSMGGYGALRYALAHPDFFSNTIILSPAVYTPRPPQNSSAREFGAFGRENALFDEIIYQRLNYPSLLEEFEEADLPLSMFIAVGDDEWQNPNPEDYLHDIDMESHLLYSRVSSVLSISAELRVYDGGHDWGVWRRGFIEGMRFIAPHLRTLIG